MRRSWSLLGGTATCPGIAALALACVLTTHVAAQGPGKTLQIVGLHGEPLELVRMCRLDRVLAIRETVEEAVRALLPEFGPSDGERLVNCFVMAPAVSAS